MEDIIEKAKAVIKFNCKKCQDKNKFFLPYFLTLIKLNLNN